MQTLKEKVVLITGASQGIGKHFALTLAKEGAFVVATSLKSELSKLESLATEITQQGGKAIALDLDLRDYANFPEKISTIIKQTKHIDVLINNAGVSYYTNFFDITEKDWDIHIDTNLKGAFFLAQAVSQHMMQQKIAGSIINIGSIAGNQSKKYALPFCVSKAGLHHLTKIMAHELVDYNIRVNTLALGLFPTELTQDYIASEAGKAFIEQIPLKRPGKYEELNGALLLLASEASTYMTGAIVEIDGGFSMDIFLRENFDHQSNAFFKSEK
jgi:3-oxoacyl-[acyl-carrier protein] reductase